MNRQAVLRSRIKKYRVRRRTSRSPSRRLPLPQTSPFILSRTFVVWDTPVANSGQLLWLRRDKMGTLFAIKRCRGHFGMDKVFCFLVSAHKWFCAHTSPNDCLESFLFSELPQT